MVVFVALVAFNINNEGLAGGNGKPLGAFQHFSLATVSIFWDHSGVQLLLENH